MLSQNGSQSADTIALPPDAQQGLGMTKKPSSRKAQLRHTQTFQVCHIFIHISYIIYIYVCVCVFYRLLYINGPKKHKISSKRSTEAATKNDPKRCCLCLLGFHLTSMESPRKRVWKTKLLLKLSIEISWGLNCCWFQLLNGISSSLCCAKVPEAPFASHCARCMQTPDAGSVETCRS